MRGSWGYRMQEGWTNRADHLTPRGNQNGATCFFSAREVVSVRFQLLFWKVGSPEGWGASSGNERASERE